jgi:hypothetical protein
MITEFEVELVTRRPEAEVEEETRIVQDSL